MNNERFITVTLAMEIAGVTRPTMIRWCSDLRIGFKAGGRWKVDREKLTELMKGERFYGNNKTL